MNITKTAMITVCGRPNVGKSSLTNALVGEKIAIVSDKPQTTRNRIYGVVNRGDTQFVLLDTPGLHKPRSRLGDYLVKVVRESLSKEEEATECAVEERINLKRLTVLAVATSIDALAVGVTFAFLDVEIISAISIIGTTTFFLSLIGVVVGNFFGARYKRRAELTGGVILILLGTKILLEHLGIFA